MLQTMMGMLSLADGGKQLEREGDIEVRKDVMGEIEYESDLGKERNLEEKSMEWEIGCKWISIDQDKQQQDAANTQSSPQQKLVQRFQYLQNLSQQYSSLAQYLDCLRNGNFQFIIVFQTFTNRVSREQLLHPEMLCDILQSLNFLHKNGICHGNICPESLQLTKDLSFRLADYAMNYLASAIDEIACCPLSCLPPEMELSFASDVWMIALLIAQAIFDRVPSFHKDIEGFNEFLESSHSDLSDHLKDLWNLIRPCLSANPLQRPTMAQLLESVSSTLLHSSDRTSSRPQQTISWLEKLYDPSISSLDLVESHNPENSLTTPLELYTLWTSLGNDVPSLLSTTGVLPFFPPVCRLPLCFGRTSWIKRPDTYYTHCQLHNSYHSKTESIPWKQSELEQLQINLPKELGQVPSDDMVKQVLGQMDKRGLNSNNAFDTLKYQFALFHWLLPYYPCTRKWIVQVSRRGVPEPLRRELWAAILNVRRVDVLHSRQVVESINNLQFYQGFEEQLARDIPRCHQYHGFLITSHGQECLEILLKGWVYLNAPDAKYWQGLDSICAPFAVLYRHDIPLALAAVCKFVQKFRKRFFVLGDLCMMQKMWITTFIQLLCFHQPKLAAHLNHIGFHPQLYAVPWFLTMFAHLLPIERLIPLWDTLMVGSVTLPLFIGIAILEALKDTLMDMDLHGCILFKANIAASISVDECVQRAFQIFSDTPACILDLAQGVEEHEECCEGDILERLGALESPIISMKYFLSQLLSAETTVLIDCREYSEFTKHRFIRSVNLDKTALLESDTSEQEFVQLSNRLGPFSTKDSLILIIPLEWAEVSSVLVRMGLKRVCVLQETFLTFQETAPKLYFTGL